MKTDISVVVKKLEKCTSKTKQKIMKRLMRLVLLHVQWKLSKEGTLNKLIHVQLNLSKGDPE